MQTTSIALALALTAAVALAGCSHPGGRVDPSYTTEAERKSGLILPEALLEFSDSAPRELVADLAELPELTSDVDGRATILLGDINNQTDAVSTSEFEMMTKRMRSNLLNSDIARSELRFTEARRRMSRIAEREQVGTTEAPAVATAYDPAKTFALNGDFYRVGRAADEQRTNLYYMEFTLTSFGPQPEIIWSEKYEVKQVKGGR